MLDLNDFFVEKFGLQDRELVNSLSSAATVEHVKQGELLVEVGEPPTTVTFLIEGIVRGYIVDETGREMTDCFAFEQGDVLVGCNGFNGPSLINFEALTACSVLRVPYATLMQMLQTYPEMLLAYSNSLSEALNRHWQIKRMLYQPAMQRYLWFLETYPGLINTICNKHIASFLGITPVSLSRLRGQLRNNTGKQ